MTSIILIESISDMTFIRHALLVHGTLIGYLITCFVIATGKTLKASNLATVYEVDMFSGHVSGTVVDKRLDILFSIGGFFLFGAAGTIILAQWLGYCKSQKEREVLLVSGILSLANGAIFAGDIFVVLATIKY